MLTQPDRSDSSHDSLDDFLAEPAAGAPTPSPSPDPPDDHDFDAVYVTSVDVVVAVRCVLDDGAATSPFWATAAAINFVGLWPNPSLHSAKERHPPPPTGSSCPLYVLHLTLLI